VEGFGRHSGFANRLHLGASFSCTIDWEWLKIPAEKLLVHKENVFIGETVMGMDLQAQAPCPELLLIWVTPLKHADIPYVASHLTQSAPFSVI
jgi:hypothetical protein